MGHLLLMSCEEPYLEDWSLSLSLTFLSRQHTASQTEWFQSGLIHQGINLDDWALVYPLHCLHCYDLYLSILTRVDLYDKGQRPFRRGHWFIA